MKYKTLEDMAMDGWNVTVIENINSEGPAYYASGTKGRQFSYWDATRKHAVGRLLSRANLYAAENLS